MIDYEKLKEAHEIACKSKNYWFKVDMGITSSICPIIVDDNDSIIEYCDDIDELIAKLKELIELELPTSKYKARDELWTLTGFCQPTKVILLHKSMPGNLWWVNIEGKLNGFSVEESNLYPTQQELIESQVKYWQSLKDPTSGALHPGGPYERVTKKSIRDNVDFMYGKNDPMWGAFKDEKYDF